MILLIGGLGQGKQAYACRMLGCADTQVAASPELCGSKAILGDISQWIAAVDDPIPVLDQLITENPQVVILCTEVGSGVVPMEPEQRAWREKVGRTCTYLAQRADRVERVFCGLPTVLKNQGEWPTLAP